eukprot:9231769-Pyramimonas_sp.AAC.1
MAGYKYPGVLIERFRGRLPELVFMLSLDGVGDHRSAHRNHTGNPAAVRSQPPFLEIRRHSIPRVRNNFRSEA